MSYDIIGDVHGCIDELTTLLTRLGYVIDSGTGGTRVTPPTDRTAVFLGDLVNRGPDTPGVLRLVMSMVESGNALAVAGNHDVELVQAMAGEPIENLDHVKESMAQMAEEPATFKAQTIAFIDGLPRWLRLDESRLIVAHAGLPLEYHKVDTSDDADEFAVYGRKVADASGQLVRYRWANDYDGEATVVYGHYSGPRAEWLNNTICLDTGCVYGGSLTALRYPERELVSIPAARVYYETNRAREFRDAAAELPGA